VATRNDFALLALLTCCLTGSAHAQNCPTRPYWPTTEWRSRADQVRATRATEIAELEKFMYTSQCTVAKRTGWCTDALIIVKGGEIVYERYDLDFGPGHRYDTRWITFGALSALTGVAVAQGSVTLADSVCDHLTGVRADNCDIDLQDLLDWGSGLEWQQSAVSKFAPGLGATQQLSWLAMDFGQGRADRARFVLGHPQRFDPGTSWHPTSGDPVALSAAVGVAMSARFGERWPWDLLFDRIGAGSSVYERDTQGTLVQWVASARDVARLGYLFLNDGCWEGARLLPEKWVTEARTVPAGFTQNRDPGAGGNSVPGRLWWTNVLVPGSEMGQMMPTLPEDTLCSGLDGGSLLFVIPSQDVVIVRLATDFSTFQSDQFIELLLQVTR
jgi:hypothetical protein